MASHAIRSGNIGADGLEEILFEHFCDWPEGCPNIATHSLGFVMGLGSIVYCDEHMAEVRRQIALKKQNSA